MQGSTKKAAAFVLLQMVAFAGPLFAADPAEPATGQPETTLETKVPNQAQGLVVHWNPETRTFAQPNAEQRARIVEEMNRWFTARFAASKGVPLDREAIAVEVLPNGARRARLPLSFMNTAIVRVSPDGDFVPACSPTPEKAGVVLHTPLAPASPTSQPMEEK